jgi:hypothetical protein
MVVHVDFVALCGLARTFNLVGVFYLDWLGIIFGVDKGKGQGDDRRQDGQTHDCRRVSTVHSEGAMGKTRVMCSFRSLRFMEIDQYA